MVFILSTAAAHVVLCEFEGFRRPYRSSSVDCRLLALGRVWRGRIVVAVLSITSGHPAVGAGKIM